MSDATSVASEYASLTGQRDPYLRRARACSELTIPALYPPQGITGSTDLPQPYQSVGARGVNNLASKLSLTLLPPSQPFFKLNIDDAAMAELAGRDDVRGEFEVALASMSKTVQGEVEVNGTRIVAVEAFRHLIVAGNYLMLLPPVDSTDRVRGFSLDKYVVQRDPKGNVLKIIVCEAVSPETLPEKAQALCKVGEGHSPDKSVEVYTKVALAGKRWVQYQEINGAEVPGSRGMYPLDKTPWVPLRMTAVGGESYGRSYVDDHFGDMHTLDKLSKAIVQGSVAAAKVVFLVNPNGQTNIKQFTRAKNGDAIAGRAEDVNASQLNKVSDLVTAEKQADRIERRLAAAFMLGSSIQRSGERVTAEEIRVMASELEDALGGVYTVLSGEFQLPLVNRTMYQLERSGKLPRLPDGTIRPSVKTGLDAIGRSHELRALDEAIAGIAQIFGPEAVSKYVKPGEYARRRFGSLGVDPKGLLATDEEVQQAEQAAMAQAMMDRLGPNAVNVIGKQMQQQGATPNG